MREVREMGFEEEIGRNRLDMDWIHIPISPTSPHLLFLHSVQERGDVEIGEMRG